MVGPTGHRVRRVLIALSLGIAACHPVASRTGETAAAEAPAFTGYVVDEAGILSVAERSELTDRLGRFERETRHQFAVVTVNGLGGADVATYTTRLANRWSVGRKGMDDGIVILVAPHERKVRIAVGKGLEQALPDAFCAEVMRRDMVPAFSDARYGAAISAGVGAIIERLAAIPRDERSSGRGSR